MDFQFDSATNYKYKRMGIRMCIYIYICISTLCMCQYVPLVLTGRRLAVPSDPESCPRCWGGSEPGGLPLRLR